MGPTRTPSYSGHCYVMVLIDDYSRFTWVKFLKEKSEALSKFTEFKEALHYKGLPKELWAKTLQCAFHVSNWLPSWPGTQKLSFELAYGEKPNERWRCMDLKTKKFTTSRDEIFDEVASQFSESSNNGEENRDYKFMFPSFDSQEESANDGVSQTQEEAHSEEVPTQVRKSTREKRQLRHLSDYEVNTVTTCFFSGGLTEEPTCYEEAKYSPDWRKAMQEEIDALENNETWELVKKPEACKPVTCKWVYRLKKNSDGTINRFKGCLAARGFCQSYGLDYEETFSLAAKMVTVRTIISLAAYKGWKLWQLDMKNAFLYGELDCGVFMEQPIGFTSNQFPEYV
ncbi:uncharacterized protein [Rutidosis leptorrhynchoides]|uniref:uncharacterized protein n=1 Tax=Rutidosis leptorrhynchoides TaxID=125765 RepID=UPI003A991E05